MCTFVLSMYTICKSLCASKVPLLFLDKRFLPLNNAALLQNSVQAEDITGNSKHLFLKLSCGSNWTGWVWNTTKETLVLQKKKKRNCNWNVKIFCGLIKQKLDCCGNNNQLKILVKGSNAYKHQSINPAVLLPQSLDLLTSSMGIQTRHPKNVSELK